jgi:deoxycytidine triphosphate deaminase
VSYQPPYDNFSPADTLGEAKRRAEFFRNRDPFPDIPRALLAAEHVAAYVRVTGMLYPFYPDDDRLKPASYEARAKNFIRWDEEGRKSVVSVQPDKTYMLPANSITFAQIESTIRLPDYIALRFNLRIKHVHRGLLLGTGPLVDPGFNGDLLIPLHNLTSDDYEISGKEGLIWIEFTKTTRNTEIPHPKGEIETHKKEVQPETYFERANKNNPIRSSIPQAVKEARERASRAEKSARGARRTVRWFAGIGIVAITGTVLGIALALHSYFGQMSANVIASNSLAGAIGQDAAQAGSDARRALDRVDTLQKALDVEKQQIDVLEMQLREQAGQIDQLRQRK